eukprot:359182-Chlamydomonas_euryale.AAC.1
MAQCRSAVHARWRTGTCCAAVGNETPRASAKRRGCSRGSAEISKGWQRIVRTLCGSYKVKRECVNTVCITRRKEQAGVGRAVRGEGRFPHSA